MLKGEQDWPTHCTCKKPIPHTAITNCPEHGGLYSYKCGACVEHMRYEEAGQAADLMRKMEWFQGLTRILSQKATDISLVIDKMRADPKHGIHNLSCASPFGMRKEEMEKISAVKICTCVSPVHWTAERLIHCPEHQGPWDAGCAACWTHLYDHELSRVFEKPVPV